MPTYNAFSGHGGSDPVRPVHRHQRHVEGLRRRRQGPEVRVAHEALHRVVRAQGRYLNDVRTGIMLGGYPNIRR